MVRCLNKLIVTFILIWTAGRVAAQPPADLTSSVSITLGETNMEKGISLIPPRRETKSRVATMGGRACRATDKATGQYWMEFIAVAEFVNQPTETGQALEVTYYDGGKGPVTLMYRARMRGVRAEHHLRIAQRTGTEEWKTARVLLPDAALAGWSGWMLRLSGESWTFDDLYVSEIRLDRKGVWLKATPDALAADGPEACAVRVVITDEAGRPVKQPVSVKLTASAGTIAPEVETAGGVAETRFSPPPVPGDTEITAECDMGRCQVTVPIVPGKGKVLTRRRTLGFEPEDALDASRCLRTFCERFEVSAETAQVYEGSGGVRLNFGFEEGKWGEATVFVGKEIPGRPTWVAVFVYSDGPACEANFVLRDQQGRTMTRHGCTLWSKGWSNAENLIDSPPIPWLQPKKEPLRYPLRLEHVVLRAMPIYGKRFRREGTVFFDGLEVGFLAAESELQPVPVEATAKQQDERLVVTLKNVSKEACHARASCWIMNPDGVFIGPLPIAKPLRLQPGEVVEFPLTFPEIPEDPQMMKPGEYAVEIAAVGVETGDLVEIQSKWIR